MKLKKSKRPTRAQRWPLTDHELDRLWEEIQAADEADAGEEADLPDGVPLPENPGAVIAIFLKRRGGPRRPPQQLTFG